MAQKDSLSNLHQSRQFSTRVDISDDVIESTKTDSALQNEEEISAVKFTVVPDIILAKTRKTFTVENEFVLLLINDLVEYIYDSWEGEPCTKTTHLSEVPKPDEEILEEKISENGSSEGEKGKVPETLSGKTPLDSKNVDSSEFRVSIKGKKRRRTIQEQDSVLDTSVKEDHISLDKTGKKRGKEKKGKDHLQSFSASSDSKTELEINPSTVVSDKATPEYNKDITEDNEVEQIEDESVFDWRLQIPDEDVVILFSQGNKYEGRVSHKMMEGTGMFTWTDGSVYTGQFVDGQITGKGVFEWPDTSWYEGEFYCGYRHGYGTFMAARGYSVYAGQWFMGHRHGCGILYFTENINDYYDGDWVMDRRCGEGIRKYPSGAYYRGEWQNDLRHGLGTMIWPNKDLYRGGWKNGLMSGYGEYTWSAFLNHQFAYPKENIYRGNWKNGLRHGNGCLEFARGGKYNGCWDSNIKHGPGEVICGNGSVVSGNPLFINDRPILCEEKEEKQEPIEVIKLKNSKNDINTDMFRKRITERNSEQVEELFFKPSRKLLKENENKRTSKSDISLENATKSYETVCLPLRVPVHAPAQDIDISDHLHRWLELRNTALSNANNCKIQKSASNVDRKIIADAEKDLTLTISAREVEVKKSTKSECALFEQVDKFGKPIRKSASSKSTKAQKNRALERKLQQIARHSSKITAKEADTEETIRKMLKNEVMNEENCLRNAIMKNLLRLRKVYSQYAAIACQEEPNFEPVLARIMLWQMYRDCGIQNKDISLVELDELLAANSNCLVENPHDPFERIYFWQFLYSLLELSWALYASKSTETESINGVLASAFQRLLFEDILPNVGHHIGSVLFDKRDLIPLTAVYLQYKTLGEPHSARQFLNNACIKKGAFWEPRTEIPVIPGLYDKVVNGTNVIGVGGDIIYISGIQSVNALSFKKNCLSQIGKHLMELNTLNLVGPSSIVDILTFVCPGIKSEEGLICNIDYQLTFLEFYEVLLLFSEDTLSKLASRLTRLASEKFAADEKLEHRVSSKVDDVISSPNTKNVSRKKKKK